MSGVRVAMTVLRKELRDALRDRRSVVSSLVYAIWGPLVMALALSALARDQRPEPALQLAVAGAERAPNLLAFLRAHRVRVTAPPADPRAAVAAGELPLLLLVAADYGDRFRAARPAELELIYDSTVRASVRQRDRVEALLTRYHRQVAELRLVMRGVVPSAVSPLTVSRRDVATSAARAGAALATLPMFLMLAPFVGCMALAIDATAGERERRSLEALLVLPLRRLPLVAGKWAAGALAAAVVTAATALVLSRVLRAPQLAELDVPIGLGVAEIVRLLVLLLPLAALAPAVQMLVALSAQSWKEAQTYLSLLLLVPMLPGFLLAFGSVRQAAWMELVPVVGHQLAASALVRGEPLHALSQAALAATTLAATAAAIFATGRLLDGERIVVAG